jgi:hypothetical protein
MVELPDFADLLPDAPHLAGWHRDGTHQRSRRGHAGTAPLLCALCGAAREARRVGSVQPCLDTRREPGLATEAGRGHGWRLNPRLSRYEHPKQPTPLAGRLPLARISWPRLSRQAGLPSLAGWRRRQRGRHCHRTRRNRRGSQEAPTPCVQMLRSNTTFRCVS